jgi:hypothetical protein
MGSADQQPVDLAGKDRIRVGVGTSEQAGAAAAGPPPGQVGPGEENLRRRCAIVLRSAAIRNVHDMVLALGLGADGVCPYVLLEVVCVDDYAQDLDNICSALRKGIEKVISTIGIHEVRGYARLFSCIGIKPELTAIFDTPAYFGSQNGGTGFAALDADGAERQQLLARGDDAGLSRTHEGLLQCGGRSHEKQVSHQSHWSPQGFASNYNPVISTRHAGRGQSCGRFCPRSAAPGRGRRGPTSQISSSSRSSSSFSS